MAKVLTPTPCPQAKAAWRECPDQRADMARFMALVEARCKVARLPEHGPLNRYGDVLPFDDNRVALRDGGYLNGSPIALLPGEAPKHIASQGPLGHTRWDFCRLLIEAKVNTLVRLTEFVDHGRPKCAPYLPEAGEVWGEGPLQVEAGPWRTLVEVRGLSSSLRERRVTLTLECGGGPVVHTLTAFHYKDWPDFGAPDLGLLHCLVCLVEDRGGSILAHCSAGIGRTGTFFGAMALFLAHAQGLDIDPVDVILHLRDQRMGMVQPPVQPLILHAFKEMLSAP